MEYVNVYAKFIETLPGTQEMPYNNLAQFGYTGPLKVQHFYNIFYIILK